MTGNTKAGVRKTRATRGRTAPALTRKEPTKAHQPALEAPTAKAHTLPPKVARRHAPERAQGDGSVDVGSLIGDTIKRMRRDRRMTLDQLATRSGVSKSYLSKIENRLSVPPIGTLSRIAQAFACDIGHFLRREESSVEDAVSIVRERERQPAVRGGTAFGYDYSSLAHKKRNKQMEPFVFTFPADIDVDTFFEHEGEEFILMLRGRAEFETRRNGVVEKWILDKGDSLYIDSQVPHRGRSLGAEAEAVVVIYQRKPAILPE